MEDGEGEGEGAKRWRIMSVLNVVNGDWSLRGFALLSSTPMREFPVQYLYKI